MGVTLLTSCSHSSTVPTYSETGFHRHSFDTRPVTSPQGGGEQGAGGESPPDPPEEAQLALLPLPAHFR